ncbi:MAG: DNA gyrase inhibitor YacG [Deltaproteobacteria bacterium]|nr:DNA gyrase inhibitor YacG [Deltaproteobacteria bacterium]MDZ4341816.1 DNA gyrase inhibitor YacG [Candidatus Binatia bacterium]
MRVKCPTCKTEVAWENNPYRPFCSERCRLIDLGAWATEKFKIPAEKQDIDVDDDDGDDQTHYN